MVVFHGRGLSDQKMDTHTVILVDCFLLEAQPVKHPFCNLTLSLHVLESPKCEINEDLMKKRHVFFSEEQVESALCSSHEKPHG